MPARLLPLVALLSLTVVACAPTSREVIATPNAPKAIGPYSQGVVTSGGRTLHTAGQIGIDPASGKLLDGVGPQTEQALENLAAILGAASMDFGDVVFTTIYVANIDDYAAVNELYAKRFAAAPPARATVAVAALPAGALVEIQMTAVAK